MMNMIELQDKLKNFSQDQLVSMMQQPTGEAPQFMVLSEITRRQKMQKEAESQQAPTQSVAQEAVTAAGVPQGGIADMARSLAPQTNVAQNTGVNPAAPPQGMPMPSAPQGPAPMAAAPQGIARMASGGVIKMAPGGPVDLDRYRELARRLVRGDNSFSSEELKEIEQIKDTPAWNEALSLEAELANSESLSDINPALPRVESSAPTPVFDATVEVPSLNQAPAADAGMLVTDNFIYGEGAASRPTYDSAAPSGLAALSPDTMPTVDGPFAYPASRFSTNLGPRAMLDWEEGQAEEAALIDARTNADLGSGRTPRYDTAIGPQPAPAQSYASTGQQGDFREPRYAPFTAANRMQAQLDEEARIAALPNRGSGNLYSVPDMQLAMDPYSGEFLQVPTLGSQAERAAKTGLATLDATGDVISNIPYNVATVSDSIANATGAKSSAYSTLSKAELNALASGTLSPADAAALEAERLTSTPTPTSTAASVLEKSDLAAELTDAMKPKPRPEDLFAPTTDNALKGGGSGSGTDSGSGGMSDYETELMKIMKSREKAAESDKWLALAQVGMGLMQGGSGSFLGDVGAAGMKGLETLRTSRDQADTDKLSLLKAREDARIDRARISASAAKGTATDPVDILKGVTEIDNQIANIGRQGLDASTLEMRIAQLQAAKNALMDLYYKSIGSSFRSPVAAGPKDLSNNPPVEPGRIRRGINAVSSFVTG
jgi:hypothetical protein